MSHPEYSFPMAPPQSMMRAWLEGPDKTGKSAGVTIDEYIKFYEATNNTFFLTKIRGVLKYAKEGNTDEFANDLTNCALLCITFAVGDQMLTTKEADDLADLLNSNKGNEEMVHSEISAENIMSLKQALLATDRYLDPNQTTLFIIRACVRLDYTNSATAAVTETLKDLNETITAKSKASKFWLLDPQRQAEMSKRLTDKETALKKKEMVFNSIGKALKQAIDKPGDVKAKLEAVTLLSLSMADFTTQFGVEMKGLADDVEDLKQLGING